MRYAFAPVALAAVVVAQGVTESISPEGSAPSGCESSYSGSFQIQTVNVTQSGMRKRQGNTVATGELRITLEDGVLKDQQQRIGYIAANRQFQFDGPPQTGAIYTAGWSVCQNGSLALGDSAIFQQCLSGGFYNLYDEEESDQCNGVYIEAINQMGGSTGSSGAGQPVSALPDGQPQAATSAQAVSQLPDGQVQQPTGMPISVLPDGQPQAQTGSPISQLPDGQIQQPTGSPIAQLPDGQIQQPTGSPISQLPDGQIQQPTGAPIAQLPDGQIQAATTRAATSAPARYTGAASNVRGEFFGLAAGLVAVAMM